MPAPTPIIDLSTIDLSDCVADQAGIAQYIPHRGNFALLKRVIWHDEALANAVGIMPVREDQFWAAGHIPGKPLLPGVLMVEAAAQLASYLYYKKFKHQIFAGFTRIENTSFRSTVAPGIDLILMAHIRKSHIKRFVSHVQGIVGGDVVFESTITGMCLPEIGEFTLEPVEPEPVDLSNPPA